MNFFTKIILGLVGILVLLWTWGTLLLYTDTPPAPTLPMSATNTEKFIVTSNHTHTDDNISTSTSRDWVAPVHTTTSTINTPSLGAHSTSTITVTLAIDGKNFVHQIEKGGTIFTLLEDAKRIGEIEYEGKNYSGLGFFVTKISVGTTSSRGQTWTYFVNGKFGSVGVAQYILSNGDVVSWKNE